VRPGIEAMGSIEDKGIIQATKDEKEMEKC
jgi:hypothetical protein